MFSSIKTALSYIGAIGLLISGVFLFVHLLLSDQSFSKGTGPAVHTAATQTAEVLPPLPSAFLGTTDTSAEEAAVIEEVEEETAPLDTNASLEITPENTEEVSRKIVRIEDPYPFPMLSFEEINTQARAALVNILCFTEAGSVRPITASGVVIDPRGVILTNAHVAQYVLLSQSARVNLSCTIRHGSPARARWSAQVLHISPTWVEKHAEDITKTLATGTGENDYALLYIADSLDGTPLPSSFPSLPRDTREGIGFLDDSVLAASYPAEFVSSSVQLLLHPLTSVTTIRELLTFQGEGVDLISIGGIASAQAGSSGGGVVNAWGRLIGIITTTSEGETTDERDLRAITLSYIDRDLEARSGFTLAELLAGDLKARATEFNTFKAPDLIELLLEHI